MGIDAPGALVAVRGLGMSYGDKQVLAGVDLTVSRGEVVCLLGPNGAGKTTTIEILEGFRTRSAGNVTVLGLDPADVDEAWRARVGVVLQSWRDHARWTPRRLLEHLGQFYAGYATPTHPRPYPADELLGLVGLHDVADHKIVTLSGGQRRRLDVAVGIVGRPELLFLDEPTAGFDPHARREFHDLIAELTRTDETTVLLTTHDLAEAERLADRILILAAGRIVADGSLDALTQQVQGESTVRWSRNGEHFVRKAARPAALVHDLVELYGDEVGGLQVSRTTLEDAYLALVHRAEAGEQQVAAAAFSEAASGPVEP